MKKGFILACVASFVLLHEGLNHFFVLLYVGNFEAAEAAQRAFGHSGFSDALLPSSFRLIPFIPLILCAAYTDLFASVKGRIALYVSLAVTIFIIFDGYWAMTRPFYTDEHISSTTALGYVFVPIAALMYSAIAGVASYALVKAYEARVKPA
ncbi:MAG: hypothetical protein JJU10_03890 [Idiomarina sp.]|nr:hypothetical protein [Idiomarina sp.]